MPQASCVVATAFLILALSNQRYCGLTSHAPEWSRVSDGEVCTLHRNLVFEVCRVVATAILMIVLNNRCDGDLICQGSGMGKRAVLQFVFGIHF